eukprot:Nk52_evm55s2657 gene=Nk52_evmTU55s2657
MTDHYDDPSAGKLSSMELNPKAAGDRRLSSFVDPQEYECKPEGSVNSLMCKLKSLRWKCRDFLGEMTGTFILIMFGCGVCAQEKMYNIDYTTGSVGGDLFAIHTGWFLGVTLGIYVCGGVTGAHLNPAVTITLAMWRGFPWKKVPVYIVAQMVGAFLGAACVYWNYRDVIENYTDQFPDLKVPNAAGIFTTFPGAYKQKNANGMYETVTLGNWPSFLDEFFGTMLLMLIIFAVNDQNNLPPGSNLAPIIVGWIVWAIGIAFGIQTGYAINPARDLAPRFFAYLVGMGGDVWNYGEDYAWIPVVGPIVGGVVGGLVYDIFIVTDKPPSVDDDEE